MIEDKNNKKKIKIKDENNNGWRNKDNKIIKDKIKDKNIWLTSFFRAYLQEGVYYIYTCIFIFRIMAYAKTIVNTSIF